MEGFSGWLAYASHRHRLAAGGLRVQAGLAEATVLRLAETMECKERLLGLAVDGAKAGIDYDPRAPGKRQALQRFVRFLRPHLRQRLSLGPDMGTTWHEIEEVARDVGLTSVKASVARAQGLDESEFRRRVRLLEDPVRGLTLGERRAGHALAHAALAAALDAGLCVPSLKVGIQGFGTLGRAAALSLHEAGTTVTAVADEHGCVVRHRGLDIDSLLPMPRHEPVTTGPVPRSAAGARELLFEIPLDVLVLAASESSVDLAQAQCLDVSVVVVGANLGLSRVLEEHLHERGVVVVPDFVGGCGGSASMDALFGAASCPSPAQVLDQLGARMRHLVTEVLRRSRELVVTPREAALSMCRRDVPPGRPYGRRGCSGAVG